MLWSRVIGQQRVKELLLSAIRSERLPHAYLFHGGEGVGKDAMALELARVLHCERRGEEACGECDSCVKIATGQHPDVRFVVALPVGKGEQSDDGPLAKLTEPEVRLIQEQLRQKAANPYFRVMIPRANIIKINSIREVRRESSMSTHGRLRRMFIISMADQMGDEAANTLLKTLEEPSGDTMFVLTTAHRESLLSTIQSRCQNVRFDPLTEEQIRDALIARESVDAERAALAARLANSSYARALDLLNEDMLEERTEVLTFIRNALASNAVALSMQIETTVEGKDRDRVTRFLSVMLMWFRDALVLSRGGTVINLDQQEDLQRFVTRFPGADIIRVMEDVERAISLVEKNIYIKLVLLQLAVRLKDAILPGAAVSGAPLPTVHSR
jgi:DNA polymerase III subunit delta'